jgi:hypothetical protein
LKVGGFEHLSTLQQCDIFKILQVFSTRVLTFRFPLLLEMNQDIMAFPQIYGFVARNASEENEESAAGEATVVALQQQPLSHSCRSRGGGGGRRRHLLLQALD